MNSVEIKVDLIAINPYSRPGIKIKGPEKVVVHYVGNPGSTAQNNRDYFNNLAKTKATYVSSHYVIGLQGEIIQCIPENEIAYGVANQNANTLHIECCHPNTTGKFTTATEHALAELLADICRRQGLDPLVDIVRHYDLSGKWCPLWYKNNPQDWVALKAKVKNMVEPQVPGKLYRVQVGAFGVKANAERYAKEIQSKGYPTIIVEA